MGMRRQVLLRSATSGPRREALAKPERQPAARSAARREDIARADARPESK